MAQESPKFLIALEDLQKVANYLVKKPWEEANELLKMIGTLKAVPPSAPAAPAAPTAPTLAAVPDAPAASAAPASSGSAQ